MMEPQQSDLYAQYVKKLGWTVERLDGVQIFLKHIPITGTIAKIHRPQTLPDEKRLTTLLQSHRVKTLVVEPLATQDTNKFQIWMEHMAKHFHINRAPFLPTKTGIIDLTPSEKDIFDSFSEAKRRGVRRAVKNGLTVVESTNIADLIKIKNKSAGLFGFITTYGISHFWDAFAPKHVAILLAHSTNQNSKFKIQNSNIVGGVLLLFWDHVAYYWIAGATKEGKKLTAPTLLVWEAIKLSKKRGNKTFDFVGVWDERIPNENQQWKGFTRFKEGFGGKELYYPTYK